jgi:hypothetical protein
LFSFAISTLFLVSAFFANFSVGNRSGYLKVSLSLPSFPSFPFSSPSSTSSGTPSSSSGVNQIPPFSSFIFLLNSVAICANLFEISLNLSLWGPAGRPRPFLMYPFRSLSRNLALSSSNPSTVMTPGSPVSLNLSAASFVPERVYTASTSRKTSSLIPVSTPNSSMIFSASTDASRSALSALTYW